MSDNQRYVNEFRGYAAYGPDGELLNLEEAIDAVVAAVRKDEECKTILRSSALGLKQTHAVFQEGKRAAARDIRALVAQGASEKEAEYYARIAEGKRES